MWDFQAFTHSVQLLSHVWFFATPWITAHQASLSITNSQSSLRLKSIESVMPSSHLILCHPLFLLPPITPSIRAFSNESTLLYIENPKDYTQKLLEVINEFSKVAEYKINVWKSIAFLYFPGSPDGKETACNAGDLGLIPGSGRPPGKGNGNSFQYSFLENPMDR